MFNMYKYSLIIAILSTVDLFSEVAAFPCTSDAQCRHRLSVAHDEEAYCAVVAFGVGCCHSRKKPAHWTTWSAWGSCSVTCGSGGIRTSRRRCEGRGSCHGNSSRQLACQSRHRCPVDGRLSDWGPWSQCSGTCEGMMKRTRTSTPPKFGGAPCNGTTEQLDTCGAPHCQVDGRLSDWGPWSHCSGTCEGMRGRTRSCTPPEFGGAPCNGNVIQFGKCGAQHCPVDGRLSDWGPWNQCSSTCEGLRKRTRTCRPPDFGGAPCNGNTVQLDHCGAQHCPVDGRLSDWGPWSQCSDTCEGMRKRTRTCTPPEFGGVLCNGNTVQLDSCGAQHCPVDGRLSDWGPWSQCSDTCEGMRKRTRTCTPPEFGGSPCNGNTVQVDSCGAQHCPVDGRLSDWGPWSQCSDTCEGMRKRTRTCTPPEFGGALCNGNTVQLDSCGAQHCPVDGRLSDWGPWSQCSGTCEGLKTRTRTCRPPEFGGAPCSGSTVELDKCGEQHCPVDGVLSAWSVWTPCSVTCGGGSKVRSRACIGPQHNGKNCTGSLYEMNNCSHTPCPTPLTSTPTAQSTTTHQQTSLAGKPCPSCDQFLTCVWNQTCSASETCMVRAVTGHGFQFTIHCIQSEDCHFMKTFMKNREIYCCDDRECIRTYVGI
ncbi:properdin-like isoform X2 [Ostrea edulis]|uniref:properdin-like isoform X2 n=1 Tax=Ostrea edulis TaxID=37623 RepID=UPI0024AEF8B4|nr:properdin-like isoform X2 [Ostrea edulis]